MYFSEILQIFSFILIFHILYAFFLYPLLIKILASVIHNPVQRDIEYKPEITILMAAYNEEELIEDAIKSVYSNSYPSDKIHLLIGSDGSNDRTNDILAKFKQDNPNIDFFIYNRIGKNAVINQLIKKVKTDLVFFLDADLRIQFNSLTQLVGLYADDTVGTVISRLNIISEQDTDNIGRKGETLYQRYETSMRINESKIRSTINSLGTLYGIRTKFFDQLPNDLVCDDLHIILQSAYFNKRIIFDNDSETIEVRKKSLSNELQRRVRTTAGGFSTVIANKKLFSPKYGWVSFFLWSHKVLRWFTPIFLFLLMLITIPLAQQSSTFSALLYIQIAFYFLACLGWLAEKANIKFLPLRMCLYFVSINYGFVLGMIRFLKGQQNAIWDKITDK
jgi:biofilm PGA synthesis N-glycosyltransferase PgaC